ncbi:hypothetical protein GW17_00049771 [Ensete ventricosum]|nr:hypothetical protein GW17_00049771 [Ensete ventricosum]
MYKPVSPSTVQNRKLCTNRYIRVGIDSRASEEIDTETPFAAPTAQASPVPAREEMGRQTERERKGSRASLIDPRTLLLCRAESPWQAVTDCTRGFHREHVNLEHFRGGSAAFDVTPKFAPTEWAVKSMSRVRQQEHPSPRNHLRGDLAGF